MSKIVKLEDVCSKGSSNIAQKDLAGIDGKYKVFGASGYIQNVNFYHQENDYIAIVKDGSGVGRVMLLPKKSSIIGTLQYIIPNPDIDVRFLYYNLIELNLSKYASGAAIPHIYFRDYRNEQIHIPSLERQREIAAVLDKANKLIEKRKEQLRELEALAESVFYDLFGDPVTNHKEWKKMQLDKLAEITSSKRIFAEEYTSNGIPFYRSKEIAELGEGKDISIELFISCGKYKEIKKVYDIPKKGDILIAAIGATIGKMWIVDDRDSFYFKDGNILWVKNNGFEPVYLSNVLYRIIDKIKERLTNGGAYPALTILTMKSLEIIYPPIELQKQFATIIEKIEEQKRKVKEAIKESEDLFHRLMQDMLTPKYQKK